MALKFEQTLLEDLLQAYCDARKHKRNTKNQLAFEINLEENIVELHNQLESRTYKPRPSSAFIVNNPVQREVFAADFADRVVHHLYFNHVNHIFEQEFIDDCYSCRKGRGTSYGVQRLEHHMRSCSQNYTRPAWVLKLDIAGYFISISRQKLYEKVYATLSQNRHSLADWPLIDYLTRVIIFNDPVENCIVKGGKHIWNGLPTNKSLFHAPENCGLPIGNLTSQLFSNVYMSDFDHHVKSVLKVRHYGRYVDDVFMIHESQYYLRSMIEFVQKYLVENFALKLHANKIWLQQIESGVQFLGTMVKPMRTYIRNRTILNYTAATGHARKSYSGIMRKHKTYAARLEIPRMCA